MEEATEDDLYGALDWLLERQNSAQVLGQTPGQSRNDTFCDELSDLGHQFPLPMAQWNGPVDCGPSDGRGQKTIDGFLTRNWHTEVRDIKP